MLFRAHKWYSLVTEISKQCFNAILYRVDSREAELSLILLPPPDLHLPGDLVPNWHLVTKTRRRSLFTSTSDFFNYLTLSVALVQWHKTMSPYFVVGKLKMPIIFETF